MNIKEVYSEEKIISEIRNVLNNHGIEERHFLTPRVINRILSRYNNDYNKIKNNYIQGELDTFKIASCLMVSINKSLELEDKVELAQISVDVAYRLIERPYYNYGPNNDILTSLETVDFSEIFKDQQEDFAEINNRLLDSLIYAEGTPLNYYNNLEMIYRIALLIKHKDDQVKEENKEPKLRKFLETFKNNNKAGLVG